MYIAARPNNALKETILHGKKKKVNNIERKDTIACNLFMCTNKM